MANTVINTPELLNLDSTTGATVLAKGTISERPAGSAAIDGTLRFNTDTNKTEYFDGTGWYEIVDEYANGFIGPATNYFDTKLYTGNGSTQSIGGYINGSGSFNGSTSKMDLPNNILPNNSTASSSCSFWFKSSSGNSTGDSETIIDAWSYSTSEPGWGLFMEPAYGGFPDGQLYLANYYLGGTSGGTGNVTFRDGNWHFGVVVLDFSGGTIKVYIDGNSTPVLSQTVSSSNVDVFTTNAAIGYQNANPSYPRHFNGAIDQVRIYSDALTTSEIAYLYANENSTTAEQLNPSGFPTNCVAAYTMDTSANGLLTTTDLSTVNYPSGAGCIALYEMNGNANDTSGTYTGTPNNITYQSGAFNEAIQYSGASSNIETNIANSNFTSNYSISFWVNLDNANTFQNFVGNYTFSPYGGFTFMSRDVGSGVYRFGFIWWYNSGAFYNYVDNNDVVATSGQWANLVVTKSSGSLPILYVNGTANSLNYRNTVTDHGSTSQNFKIGNTLNNNYSAGLIDQVRIFNTALTQSQVTTLARGIATSYSGTNTNVNFNGHLDFQPGLTWVKARDAAHDHVLVDSVNGAGSNKGLSSNATYYEGQYTATYGYISSLDSNGFTVSAGSSYANYTNVNNEDYVSWNWKAEGAAVTNNDGTIASQVSANKDSGFSIVTYTGASGTVGHGLTSTPQIIIQKQTNGTLPWYTYIPPGVIDSTSNYYYLELNTTAAKGTTGATPPTSTTFNPVSNSGNFVAYCWHSVNNFSKINFYTGTGSSGNSIVIGFQPRFLMVKRTDSTSNWRLYNSAMGTGVELYANTSAAEASATGYLNFNSTGFEITTTGGWLNANGGTYLYMAIA